MQFAWPWGPPTDFSMKLEGEWPRITIITPNYNGANYIEATLRSVICQGYPNLQYIVVDGASKDNSMEIIERYKDHIDHIICEPDKGHADALNKGFAKADGEILAWLNSDDLHHPWTLFTIAEIFKQFPQVRWLEGTPVYWDEKGRLHGAWAERPFNAYDYLIGRYGFIQQESVFWRRDLWEEAGGRMNTDYRLMIDGELWARFFLHAKLWRVNTILSGFRLHTTNRSHNRDLVDVEMQRAIETMRTQIDPEVRERAHRYRFVEKMTSWLPTVTLRTLVPRWLCRADLKHMEYEVILRDPEGNWYNRGLWFR